MKVHLGTLVELAYELGQEFKIAPCLPDGTQGRTEVTNTFGRIKDGEGPALEASYLSKQIVGLGYLLGLLGLD